jgi:anti-anti-sigma regulatory factor
VKDSNVCGIEVRERGEEGVLVELRGEFDRHDLRDLIETLNDVLALRLPVALDLSGVGFSTWRPRGS